MNRWIESFCWNKFTFLRFGHFLTEKNLVSLFFIIKLFSYFEQIGQKLANAELPHAIYACLLRCIGLCFQSNFIGYWSLVINQAKVITLKSQCNAINVCINKPYFKKWIKKFGFGFHIRRFQMAVLVLRRQDPFHYDEVRTDCSQENGRARKQTWIWFYT